jgi:2,3,4,5-tetrahydropyridine-2-carboxylate N-succinyltransferase
MSELEEIVNYYFENRAALTASNIDPRLYDTVNTVIDLLDKGKVRVAEKIDGQWHVHQWLKKAVLLYFKMTGNQLFPGGFTNFYDKVPLKYTGLSEEALAEQNVRIVPPACVRKGAFVAANTILMPSYVNIGAYVDTGTLVDTWATVGSCAQIGKNVQANPTIIEDNCFIGARSEVVEGVIVEEGSVISMGVYLGQSTKIYHREKDEILYGRVPAGSVVVSGNLPSKGGKYSLYCAVIVKQVDQKTREKVSINELLRNCEELNEIAG